MGFSWVQATSCHLIPETRPSTQVYKCHVTCGPKLCGWLQLDLLNLLLFNFCQDCTCLVPNYQLTTTIMSIHWSTAEYLNWYGWRLFSHCLLHVTLHGLRYDWFHTAHRLDGQKIVCRQEVTSTPVSSNKSSKKNNLASSLCLIPNSSLPYFCPETYCL